VGISHKNLNAHPAKRTTWQSVRTARHVDQRRSIFGREFEIEAFFSFSETERRVIEERRHPVLKLALALQIGFLRMSGRLLEAVRIVPPSQWRHLGEHFSVAAPDLASLRSMYHRRRTLFEHQEVACEMLELLPSLATPKSRAIGV
jgi:hypothetical protein